MNEQEIKFIFYFHSCAMQMFQTCPYYIYLMYLLNRENAMHTNKIRKMPHRFLFIHSLSLF